MRQFLNATDAQFDETLPAGQSCVHSLSRTGNAAGLHPG